MSINTCICCSVLVVTNIYTKQRVYTLFDTRCNMNMFFLILKADKPMQTEFAHQNFYNRFKMELGEDPILFPAEPNQFSAVVDKVMVGTTAEIRRLADEAMKEGYIPSESLTGKPSKESCAGPIRHQFAIDNPQLL